MICLLKLLNVRHDNDFWPVGEVDVEKLINWVASHARFLVNMTMC